MPTPRPETSVTWSAVLKPGRKMKSRASASLSRAASLRVDAATVVGNFDDDLVPLVIGVQPDDALRRLPKFLALFSRLDAVTHRVAHEMGERFGDGIENSLVEVGVLSAEIKLDFAAALTRNVAHHAG